MNLPRSFRIWPGGKGACRGHTVEGNLDIVTLQAELYGL